MNDFTHSLPSVSLSDTEPLVTKADVLILGIRGTGTGCPEHENVADLLDLLGFTGERDQVMTFPAGERATASVIVAVALPAEPSEADLRAAAARGLRAAPKGTAAIAFHPTSVEETVAVAEGARLGGYRYDRYKTSRDDSETSSEPREVTILSLFAEDSAALVEQSDAVTQSVAQVRHWVNASPSDQRPPIFADEIAAYSAAFVGNDVAVEIWDEVRLAEENCGGIIGVGLGSAAPPRLVTLTYAPADATTHLALVGKGITYDSGGLSIKPAVALATMKMDMAGAAAVVGTTLAVTRLGLPIKITTYACLAENMPSGAAFRPGDVLAMRNGSTVEIHNTDAEGRLVIADGLALAVAVKPDQIIDVATLTGACMVALGERTTGVLGTDEGLIGAVLSASRTAGESMWPLPITDEMGAAVRSSTIADLRQHDPKPYGGAMYAAAFLREFVGEVPWAHLDIAGPSFNNGSAYDEIPSGGTGVAVRTLVQLVRDMTS